MKEKTDMKLKLFGNEEKIRKQQLELISMLNRWYCVKEDLIFAFEKCSESNLGEPMKSYTKAFIIRIKGGLGVEQSLKLFSDSVSDKNFNNFITQIRFNLKYRGNTGELLDNIESQLLLTEQERTRKKISSARDRLYLIAILILTPVLFIATVLLKPSARELFLNTTIGKVLIIPGILSYVISLLIMNFTNEFD